MTRLLRYLTHPQIVVDSALPVPGWHLSNEGRERLERMPVASLTATTSIVSSKETKAIETAEIIGRRLGVGVITRPAMHENDRSATGFLLPDEFEKTADAFFADPLKSVRGWETAQNAQTRIVNQTLSIINQSNHGDLLLVGHGAVGTLLYCHFVGEPISRKFDQPSGGGNYFSIDLRTRKAVHHWKPIEKM